MHRSKRLLILVGVLAVVCAAAFLATRVQEQQEQVEASGETVLAIDTGNVASLAWTSGEGEYAFHKDGTWLYDADEAFPVSAEALEELLAPFSSFNAAFVIRDVTDYAQYGLEEPECTIEIGTADASYTIALGDMSAMDDQRYVSIGDGNVYLAVTDPMDAFAVELSDLIDNDEIPQMDTVTALSLTGAVEETIAYVEAGGPSYSDEDVYFLQSGEESLPLDTDLVEDYLGGIRNLVLTDYATYNATEIELASFGLNDPALTVTVEYEQQAEAAEEGAEPETTAGALALHIGRVEAAEESAEETDAAAEETEESAEDAQDGEETAQEDVQYAYYLRVGDSQIVYNLSDADGEALFAASYDDLRHRQLFWGDFDDVTQATILLDNHTYTLTAQTAETAETGEDADAAAGSAEPTAAAAAEEDAEITWTCNGEPVDVTGIRDKLAALTAEAFTEEAPADQLEISLTLDLNDEDIPQVRIQLYRYDGASCLAVLDGEPAALVAREDVVDLMEAVRTLLLG